METAVEREILAPLPLASVSRVYVKVVFFSFTFQRIGFRGVFDTDPSIDLEVWKRQRRIWLGFRSTSQENRLSKFFSATFLSQLVFLRHETIRQTV